MTEDNIIEINKVYQKASIYLDELEHSILPKIANQLDDAVRDALRDSNHELSYDKRQYLMEVYENYGMPNNAITNSFIEPLMIEYKNLFKKYNEYFRTCIEQYKNNCLRTSNFNKSYELLIEDIEKLNVNNFEEIYAEIFKEFRKKVCNYLTQAYEDMLVPYHCHDDVAFNGTIDYEIKYQVKPVYNKIIDDITESLYIIKKSTVNSVEEIINDLNRQNGNQENAEKHELKEEVNLNDINERLGFTCLSVYKDEGIKYLKFPDDSVYQIKDITTDHIITEGNMLDIKFNSDSMRIENKYNNSICNIMNDKISIIENNEFLNNIEVIYNNNEIKIVNNGKESNDVHDTYEYIKHIKSACPYAYSYLRYNENFSHLDNHSNFVVNSSSIIKNDEVYDIAAYQERMGLIGFEMVNDNPHELVDSQGLVHNFEIDNYVLKDRTNHLSINPQKLIDNKNDNVSDQIIVQNKNINFACTEDKKIFYLKGAGNDKFVAYIKINDNGNINYIYQDEKGKVNDKDTVINLFNSYFPNVVNYVNNYELNNSKENSR